MRSSSPIALDRRARTARRRTRRRSTVLTAGLAFGVIAAVAVSTVPPVSTAEESARTGGFALASFTLPAEPTAIVAAGGTDEISTEATQAMDDADAAIDAAAQVTADVKASGLKLGDVETTVDTAELGSAAERLAGGLDLPAPLVPDLIDDVTALVASVEASTAEVRGSLNAAKALKAKQEAAAKAKREAAARAAAAAAEAAASQSSGGGSAPSPVAVGGGASPAEAQSIAKGMLSGYGWGGDQFSCLVSLWNKESGWNYRAYNSSSGAYGIPQALPGSKMGSAGADWQTSAATQIRWGFGYIAGRYGTPCGAWSHSQSVGWY
ncbi:lytic transglycosylase domain-containing protein [Microbacterium sp. SSM24]|uniref:aggregation-promoting factor C-terminal-like domain-containing protein n=1 Tax=Microbacterium sp. SSM24 TaxID=2991714 RepID=UPI002227ED10|nr:lytic transglycosylase domain-containing protein [Microbacterium sp. SSM24]MCW3492119.1 lytic transglycosylase domain-containing protein [Microbacterium sp. SSM24]